MFETGFIDGFRIDENGEYLFPPSTIHTNIVAKDLKRLAKFYQDVFGCIRVLPERNLKGRWIDTLTEIYKV